MGPLHVLCESVPIFATPERLTPQNLKIHDGRDVIVVQSGKYTENYPQSRHGEGDVICNMTFTRDCLQLHDETRGVADFTRILNLIFVFVMGEEAQCAA